MTPLTSKDPLFQELLSAYLDGHLSSSETENVESILQEDADLRKRLAELKALRSLLRSLPELRPPRSMLLTNEQLNRTSFPYRRSFPYAIGSVIAAAFFLFSLLPFFPSPASSFATAAAPVANMAAQESQGVTDLQPEATLGAATEAPALLMAAPTETAAPGAAPLAIETATREVEQSTSESTTEAARMMKSGNDMTAEPTISYPPPTEEEPPFFLAILPYLVPAISGLLAVILAILAIGKRKM